VALPIEEGKHEDYEERYVGIAIAIAFELA